MSCARPLLRLRPLLIACACLLLAACKASLYSGLPESEANVMIALLAKNGISATKELDARSGSATIMVDEAKFSQAVSLLEQHGLPTRDFATVDKIFTGGGLVTSPVEEHARLNYAISQELSRTITELDGILSARVHIVLPNDESVGRLRLNDKKAKPSASVVIRRRESLNFDDLAPRLKHVVSNSVEGLDYEDIAVIDFPVPDAVSEVTELPAQPDVLSSAISSIRIAVFVLVAVALAVAGIGAALWKAGYLKLDTLKTRLSGSADPKTPPAPEPEVEPESGLPKRKLVRLEDM